MSDSFLKCVTAERLVQRNQKFVDGEMGQIYEYLRPVCAKIQQELDNPSMEKFVVTLEPFSFLNKAITVLQKANPTVFIYTKCIRVDYNEYETRLFIEPLKK